MPQTAGIDPTGWKFEGTRLSGILTRKFTLVQVGEQPNLQAVKDAIGRNVEGQWLKALQSRFSTSDGMGPIAIADDSWVSPSSRRFLPCLDDDVGPWLPIFVFASSVRHEWWRWVVYAD